MTFRFDLFTDWLRRCFAARKLIADHDWRHVPRPNWACKRGGIDIW